MIPKGCITIVVFLITLGAQAQSDSNVVYVCKHYASHSYHTSISCKGLLGCQNGQHTSKDSALSYFKRKPCCLCVGGMLAQDSGNCKTDDLPKSKPARSTSSGGWNGDGCSDLGSGCNDPYAAAIVGSIAVAGLVIMLSNDLYVGGTYSHYTDFPDPERDGFSVDDHYIYPGFGIDAHLRKNFEILRLEYGGSYMKHKAHYYATSLANGSVYEFDDMKKYFTAYAGMPFYLNGKYSEKSLLFFFGPVFRWNYEPAVGGTLGFHIRMGEFFKFDLRYELTQITSQVQAGFVITYQREYIWNR